MIQKSYGGRRPFKKEEKYFVGLNIRSKDVRCLDGDINHGVISLSKALDLAEEKGLDLVQISNGPTHEIPVCKIVDFSKFKYEASKKEKFAKKKQRENAIKIKEIKFRPSTDSNDLKTKAKHAQEFINEGHKLKITIAFKGREIAHKDIAMKTISEFMAFLSGAQFEAEPSLSGRFLSAMVIRKMENTIST